MIKKVVGLVGPIASGKGTVAQYLSKKGYKSYSLSDRIREEITARGLIITRESLNTVSNELREKFGPQVLAELTAKLIERDNPELVVVDAIRNPAEVNFLKQKFGARIIGVVADQKKRFELFMKRGTNTTGISSWEEFRTLDNAELFQNGEHKQQVNKSLELADFIIENNGTFEELNTKVDEAIATFFGQKEEEKQ